MIYRLYNYGNSRTVPYKGMNVFVGKNQFLDIEDKEMADALSAFPCLDIVETADKENYEKMNFFKLKKLAKDKDIEFDKKIKKIEVIKLLNETR
ncbi:hypothetical protein ES705_19849 [subsurface metagenome]